MELTYKLNKDTYITIDLFPDAIVIIDTKTNKIIFIVFYENGEIREIEYFVPYLKKKVIKIDDRKDWYQLGIYSKLRENTREILRKLKDNLEYIDNIFLRVKIRELLKRIPLDDQ